MFTLTEMRNKVKSIMTELGDMKAAYERENRLPSEDERLNATEMLNKVDELEAQISLEERTQATQERLEKPVEEARSKVNPILAKQKERQERKDSFASFGEQMSAVMRAGMPGGSIDARLNTRAATGLSESVPSDGGFLVQQDFSNEIFKQVFETGVLAPRCRRIPISGNSNSLTLNGIDETSRVAGSRWGGIRGYWLNEAGEKTAAKPKFRKIELKLNKLIGLCYATDELLEDAGALEGVIRQGFESEFGFLIDDAIINGTGAGMPLGIKNAGCLVTASKETGQAATTLEFPNISNMWARLPAASRTNAVWLINQDVEPQMHQFNAAVGTGGTLVYMPPGGISETPYSSLFGRPVIPIEQCQTLGTKGDIYLADFSNYILAEKGGMSSDMSIHVRFIYDESVFRFVLRLDGQPILNSAITPYKGSNDLSHFIALESRT